MDKLKKFITGLFILFLVTGCRTGIPLETSQVDLQEIERVSLEGNWNEVISYSEKYLEKNPDNAIVHFVLGMAYYMKEEYGPQEKQHTLALKDEQSMDAIIAWGEDLVQRFPKNYYAHFLLGSAYPIKDEMEKAMKSYRKAIEINPNFADAYVGLGAIYFENEQIDEAIKYFKKAVEINPNHVAARLNLASVYEYNDQVDEAIASYEKVIEINPHFTGAYVYLGDLYLEKGDREKAMKAYKKVMELDPDGELGRYAKEKIEQPQEHQGKDPANTETEKKP